MKNVCTIGLIILTLTLQGCLSSLSLEDGLFGPDPWGEPVWGQSAEGLRCRLSVYKRKWKTSETPTLTFDLQNNGKRTFAFWPQQKYQLCKIQMDGKWHQWSPTELIDSHVWDISPGTFRRGVILELRKEYHLELKPGRHVVRIAVMLEDVRVISNPVGIEIVR